MPKLLEPHNLLCDYCGAPATHYAFNSKKNRCCEKINLCPAVIQKQNDARIKNTTKEQRSANAKKASIAAQEKLKELHKDPEWSAKRSKSISESIEPGSRMGKNNPMHGKTHNTESRAKMSAAAAVRDNTNIGKYKRTAEHRDLLSKQMIDKNLSGKLTRSRDTKPELMFAALLDELSIEFEKQFLIQFGKIGVNRFRHCYDFKIKHLDVLIEIDGDYWHSLPEIIERDKICESVASEKGYKVLRFKQSELENDYDRVKRTMSDYKS